MQSYKQKVQIVRIVADALVICGVFAIVLLNVPSRYIQEIKAHATYIIPIVTLFWYLIAKVNGLYDNFRSSSFTFELIAIIKSLLTLIITFIVFLFLLKERLFSRSFVVAYSIFLISFMILERFLMRKYFEFMQKKGKNLRTMLIVGAGFVGKNFYDSIIQNPQFGYRFMGFLDDRPKPFLNGQYLGRIDKLDYLLARNQIDDVIVALPNYAFEKIDQVIKTCEQYTTLVRIIPDYLHYSSGKYEVTIFDQFPVFSIRNDSINHLHSRIFKRLFDLILTTLLFVFVFSWLWIIIALAIKFTSKGPIFFVQERWGRRNQKVNCIKFRSMRQNSSEVDKDGNYLQADKNDPRVTKIGKILRKTNLDELPQFLNVLKGELSIVGPRPHPTPLNLASRARFNGYMLRTLVKPGITGWAQVHGLRGSTKNPKAMENRVKFDLWYIENWSIWLDIEIVFLTIWAMIKGDENAY